MSSFSLSIYTIRVASKSGQHVKLGEINGTSLRQLIEDHLTGARGTLSLSTGENKVIRVEQFEASENTFKGIIRTGKYGYESELIDSKDGKVTHKKKATEAELTPFYFLIFAPDKFDEGVVVLQRFENFGIRTILLSNLEKYFRDKVNGYYLRINPLISSKQLDHWLEGRLTKIRLTKFGLPKGDNF
ncbi:hypothetical protein [Gloeobacter morelensis]|uniref:Uncharacterized protein n=1 Tax=Gloeobacter morelensis MG652769 TaxID=2781736 RepID=A0ABY3PQV2_9CYAN|nr:hypothetical protein [Gloeobacter morelensis]UFP96024.1 hypothetical protein ISF26_07370 [Gloeobacter morelensis MG652769]